MSLFLRSQLDHFGGRQKHNLDCIAMKHKPILRILLIAQTIFLLCYTFFAFRNEGARLFTQFYSTVLNGGWNGQFNLDFSCYLVLSGIWLMWRNKFSAVSVALGIIVSILGIIAFAPYILFLLVREKGELKRLLVGDR